MEFDNSHVRRQDRLLGEEQARELLRCGEYGTLSMCGHGGRPYGIPVNYVWDGASVIYIHCAPQGKKLGCIRENPYVSFCVVGRTGVLPSKFTTEYESVVLECRAFSGIGDEEKQRALELIVGKYSPEYRDTGSAYIEKSFHRTGIIRLDIDTWAGKTKKVR